MEADAERQTINLTDEEGMTALHWASVMENADVVRFLEAAGADRTVQDKSGKVAADWRGGGEDEEEDEEDEGAGARLGGETAAAAAAAAVANEALSLSEEGAVFRDQLAGPLARALEAVLDKVEKTGEMTEGDAVRAIAEHLMRNNSKAKPEGGVAGGGLSVTAKAAGLAVRELV